MFLDRFAPPEEPSRHLMDLQEKYEDAKWNYRNLGVLIEDLEDCEERELLVDRREALYFEMQDLLQEMEEAS